MKTIRLGSIFTDTATILIGDPCKVLQDKEESRMDWDDFVDACGDFNQKVVKIGNGAIFIQTGCDGWYPVFLETDDAGDPKRLVIELGGQVNP